LLLKAFFLKNGYCINKVKDKKKPKGSFPFRIEDINIDDFKDDDTITFSKLIEVLYKIEDFGNDKKVIDKGLRIAKVFRNKEGHVVVLWHDYEPENYRDIEASLVAFYKTAFKKKIQLHFSVGDGEQAVFNV